MALGGSGPGGPSAACDSEPHEPPQRNKTSKRTDVISAVFIVVQTPITRYPWAAASMSMIVQSLRSACEGRRRTSTKHPAREPRSSGRETTSEKQALDVRRSKDEYTACKARLDPRLSTVQVRSASSLPQRSRDRLCEPMGSDPT